MELDDIQNHSLKAGREAARFLKENFGKNESYAVDIKGDGSLVTRLDRESQEIIISYLGSQFPDVPFIAEEQENDISSGIGKEDYYFVVDPLDGTSSYVIGLPVFCTSIALCKGTQPVVGTIVDPNQNEEFTAIKGGGARLNGNPIAVTKRHRLEELYLNVYHTKFDDELFRKISYNIVRKIKRFHRLGSHALEVAYVAAGRFDGSINNNASIWDIASAVLMVEEAGGRWSLIDGGRPDFPVLHKMGILSTNGLVHADLLECSRI